MKSMELTRIHTLSILVLTAFALIAIPSFSFAATYAYVNTSGEVMTTESATWQQAIATAPNIAARSGVLLIDSAADSSIVGDNVSGS